MSVALIWAQAANGVIGDRGRLPWQLPEDLARFRKLTWGATVVMGRLTWQSLPERVRPLPGRCNVVLTRQPGFTALGAVVADSLGAALAVARGDVWIIGGASVYRAGLAHADRVVVTELEQEFCGDTQAPYLGREWIATGRDPQTGWHRSRSGLGYRVVTYVPANRSPDSADGGRGSVAGRPAA